jgi:hypothetical protein
MSEKHIAHLDPVYPSKEITIVAEFDADDKYLGAHNYFCYPSLGFEGGKPVYDFTADRIPINFVKKSENGTVVAGLQSEQLLLILIDRHQKLNAVFPSEYNDQFIAGVVMALEAMRQRVNDRVGRGVMGALKQ